MIVNLADPYIKPLGKKFREMRLCHSNTTSNGNPTFVIGDPMKKVQCGKNKSHVSSASAKFNPSLFPMVYDIGCESANLYKIDG